MKYPIPIGATEVDISPVFSISEPPIPNLPPVVNAGGSQTIQLPANSIKLNGVASDPDGTIVSFQWSKTAGPSGTIASPNSAVTNVTGLVEGNYVFQLTVTDEKGAKTSSTTSVIVKAEVVIPVPTGSVQGYGALVKPGQVETVICNDLTESALKNAIGTGNRIVRFGRSGTIRGRFNFSNLKNISIEGEGKVIIDNNGNGDAFSFEGNGCGNITLRGLSVRNAGNDCIGIRCNDVVIDHCSFDGAVDGLVDITVGAKRITVQWSIFGKAGAGSMLVAYAGTENISIHHNAFFATDRNALVHRANDYKPTQTETLMVEFGNNVVNQGSYGTIVAYGATLQAIANYYMKSSNAIMVNPYKNDGDGGSKIFSKGNIVKGGASVGSSNHAEWIIPEQFRVAYTDALTAMRNVKEQAGTGVRDARDIALMNSIS